MAFAEKISIAATTRIDLFSGIADTGVYEVIFPYPNPSTTVKLSSNVAATDGIYIQFGDYNPGPFRFTWDSSQPLYLYNSSGTSQDVSYMLTKVASVGLSVNCS